MQFIVVTADWPVSPCLLPLSQIRLHATASATDGNDTATCAIDGASLINICQAWMHTHPAARTGTVPQLSTFGLAMLQHTCDDGPSPLRLFPPTCVTKHVFDLHAITAADTLVVFLSRWESLSAAALVATAQRTQTSGQTSTPPHTSPNTAESPHGNKTGSESQSSAENGDTRGAKTHPNQTSAAQTFTELETHFTSIPATVTARDVDWVNRLMQRGGIRLDSRVAAFRCVVCARLPLRTRTTACCAAVVCEECAPRAAMTCAVCGETPMHEAAAHPERDAEVMRMVREWRVLYRPQWNAQMEAVTSPTRSPSSAAKDARGPVLGSIL